jgi:hypothetical protein
MAQLALYDTEIIDMSQVFLPFAMEGPKASALGEMVEGRFLLGLRPEKVNLKTRHEAHAWSYTERRSRICARL